MEEEQRLLPHNEEKLPRDQNDCVCEDWSDHSSYTSYYSDSDSSIPEWESSIDSSGELLFIDCDPVVSQVSQEAPTHLDTISRNEIRKSTRNKFLKLLRRRDSKRRSKRPAKSQDGNSQDTTKVKFQDHQEGEVRDVILKIDQTVRKTGRRADLVELLLGLTISTLSDGNRVMVAGFVPDSEAARQKSIKIGDWLKSINDEEVFIQNLNGVLDKCISESEVTLKLQRVAGVEVTKNPPRNELTNQSSFVQQLINKQVQIDDESLNVFNEECMGIVYINTNNLSEGNSEFDEVVYCFPPPRSKNLLCLTRGACITLNQLLVDVVQDRPHATSILYKNRLVHIVYTTFGSDILLLMLPDSIACVKELTLLNNELIRILEFLYQRVEKCFESNKALLELDSFFVRMFTRILTNGVWTLHGRNGDFQKLPQSFIKFEATLPGTDFVTLPCEIQMQIGDALSELEACDYREWNDDPLDCQRLFTILGSAFFHSGHLLASHFTHEDLIDIVFYCRQSGVFHLSRTEPVRSLVLWREVFPFSCNRGIETEDSSLVIPDGKRFLLIVGNGKDLLIALMEAGGCTEPPEENTGPDPFYVEEVQATLSHLQELGIPAFADRWLETQNAKVTLPELQTKKKSDFFGHIISAKSTPPSPSKDSSSPILKKQEVTSILKRRSSDQGLITNSSSAYSLTDDSSEVYSEDSASQGGYSERSEVSDEPILGRRAVREKRTGESDDEESDIEDYRDGSQSNSSYDLNELRQSLLSESRDGPNNYTAGSENVLFHYVHLDCSEGILLSPLDVKNSSKVLNIILENFKKICHHIRTIFQNTLRFKEMAPQDMSKCVMNKNLVAIKEYGTLFECNLFDENTRKFGKLTYWVVGRLFDIPHPREIYVCYQDSVAQNMVEVAFKLAVSLGA